MACGRARTKQFDKKQNFLGPSLENPAAEHQEGHASARNGGSRTLILLLRRCRLLLLLLLPHLLLRSLLLLAGQLMVPRQEGVLLVGVSIGGVADPHTHMAIGCNRSPRGRMQV